MNKFFKNFGFWILLIVILFTTYYFMSIPTADKSISFSQLVNEINNGNIKSIEYVDNNMTVEMKNGGQKKTCYLPSLNILYEHAGDAIKSQVEKNELTIKTPEPESLPWWISMLPTILLLVIMIAFWAMMFRQSGGSGRGTMNFGKSRAKMHVADKNDVTFRDVAGADAENEELEEIVESLKRLRSLVLSEQRFRAVFFWWDLREQVKHFLQKLLQAKREFRFSL